MSFPEQESFPEENTKKRRCVWVAAFLACVLGVGTAQTQSNGGQQPAPADQQPPTTPAPVYNQGTNAPAETTDNPPISSLDQPTLESRMPARSFLVPGIHVSEAVDSNVGQSSGSSSFSADTRAMGSLMFQKIANRYMTAFDYVGGITYYSGYSPSVSQVQEFDGEQRFVWHRGDIAIRDRFSYLPEGAFGFGTYGESGAYDSGLTGIGYVGGSLGEGMPALFSASEFSTLGVQPRITNLSVVDMDQSLTQRSSITLAGGYGILHFTDNSAGFIDSNQVVAQAGYDYQLTRRNQIAFLYGFQDFMYPNFPGASFTTHIGTIMFGHRITGRMDFIVGAGPQVTLINNPFVSSTAQVSVAARAALRYRFPRTTLQLYYDRYNTAGSGYFLGAVSNIVRLTVSRPLTRVWTAGADVGYSYNSELQPGLLGLLPATTQSFQYLYAGAALRRPLGEHFSMFVSYQFNDLFFGGSGCLSNVSCSLMSQRHIAAIGLDWHPHPIRLD